MDEHNIQDNQEELEKYKQQCEECLNNWKRERADFINYKKNQERTNLELWLFHSGLLATMDTIRDFLTGADRFENNKNLPGFSEFMEVYRFIRRIEQDWAQLGIRKISIEGQKFDPKFHEAISQEERGEKVVEVSPGYMIGETVIRPARVRIVK